MSTLLDWLTTCEVCPNFCRVNRRAGETGRCRTLDKIVVSSADLHFGEESCLVGSGGSGTIFFTACNLSCVFCQNWEISALDRGAAIGEGELVRLMFSLRMRGAENVNLVSPTHQAPQIFEAVRRARAEGLAIPIVYNCGGYENPALLRELDSLVDIYMPDFKYGGDTQASSFSGVERYVEYCTASLMEMHRQVGDLRMDARGVARRGLLVRHLVLPGGISGSRAVIDFLAELSTDTYLNIMDQYHPAYRASEYPALSRRPTRTEMDDVIGYARSRGMTQVLC